MIFGEVAFEDAVFNADAEILANLRHVTESFRCSDVVGYEMKHVFELLFRRVEFIIGQPELISVVFVNGLFKIHIHIKFHPEILWHLEEFEIIASLQRLENGNHGILDNFPEIRMVAAFFRSEFAGHVHFIRPEEILF